MADGLMAFPARRASEDPQTAVWLTSEGVVLTTHDFDSRGTTLAEVHLLLERLGSRTKREHPDFRSAAIPTEPGPPSPSFIWH